MVSGAVAVAFALNGLWVVLPFTAVELGVLTACLYYCVRRTHTVEVVRLTPAELVLERGIHRPTKRWAFDRYLSRFLVAPSRHAWYPTRIKLRCRDREVEVGRFLSDADRNQLQNVLRQMIRRLDQAERTESGVSEIPLGSEVACGLD